MKIYIRLDGHLMAVDLNQQGDIKLLKDSINIKYGIPREDQRLFIDGKELEDQQTIAEVYKKDQLIKMWFKESNNYAMVSLKFLLPDGTTSDQLAHKLQTVHHFKQIISEKINEPVENLRFWIGDNKLADNLTFFQCMLENDREITCTTVDVVSSRTNQQGPIYQHEDIIQLKVKFKNKEFIHFFSKIRSIYFLRRQLESFFSEYENLVFKIGNDRVLDDDSKYLFQYQLQNKQEIICTLKSEEESRRKQMKLKPVSLRVSTNAHNALNKQKANIIQKSSRAIPHQYAQRTSKNQGFELQNALPTLQQRNVAVTHQFPSLLHSNISNQMATRRVDGSVVSQQPVIRNLGVPQLPAFPQINTAIPPPNYSGIQNTLPQRFLGENLQENSSFTPQQIGTLNQSISLVPVLHGTNFPNQGNSFSG